MRKSSFCLFLYIIAYLSIMGCGLFKPKTTTEETGNDATTANANAASSSSDSDLTGKWRGWIWIGSCQGPLKINFSNGCKFSWQHAGLAACTPALAYDGPCSIVKSTAVVILLTPKENNPIISFQYKPDKDKIIFNDTAEEKTYELTKD